MSGSKRATPPRLINIRFPDCAALQSAMDSLRANDSIREVLPIVTCERAELFLITRDEADLPYAANTSISSDAVLRLFQLAAGVLSSIPGERSVADQLAAQLRTSLRRGESGSLLAALVKRALAAGKQLRRRVEEQSPIMELSDLVADIVSQVPDRPITLLGSGKLGREIQSALTQQGRTLRRWATRQPRSGQLNCRTIEQALGELEPDAILITALGGARLIHLPEHAASALTIDLGMPPNLHRAEWTMDRLVNSARGRLARQLERVERAAHRLPALAEAALAETLCPQLANVNRSIAQFRHAIVERELARMEPILAKLPADDATRIRRSIQHAAARSVHPMHEYVNALGRQGRADDAQRMVDHLLGSRVGWSTPADQSAPVRDVAP